MRSKTRTSKRKRGRHKARRKSAKRLTQNPFTAVLGEVKRDVEVRMRGLLDARIDAVREHGPEATRLVAAIRDLSMRGGKRLRAALLVTGYRSVTDTETLDPALDAAVAVELLQSYFLIHDDWMDDDDVRRGGPSVHARLREEYRSERAGASSAILAGDYAAALATEALGRVEIPPARLPSVIACFAQMQADAVIGQQLDVTGKARSAEAVYTLKTSSYTVRGPLRLGALLAGASPAVLRTLDRYAHPIGIAFQLRDDLLGLFGDPKKTGKPRGSDLAAGKRTSILARAERHARGADSKAIRAVVGNRRASGAALERAVLAIERTGAAAAMEQRITELTTEGLSALRSGSLSATGEALLVGAAMILTARRS